MTPATPHPSDSPAPLGIIGGSAFLQSVELSDAQLRTVDTPRGAVSLHVGPDFVFLRRHGEGPYRHPHQIPHHAHVLAFEALGVKKVAAFTSTGSLRAELRPGDVLLPDDYLSFHPPPTFAEEGGYLHIVPALDADVRELLKSAAGARLAAPSLQGLHSETREPSLWTQGVYAESRGPRFETAAEVRLLAVHAHVAGMTAASEATLCQERGIGYAMVCIVDNWAHGVGSTKLTLEAFQASLAQTGGLARSILAELLASWRQRSR